MMYNSLYKIVYQDEKPSALTIGLPIFSIIFYMLLQHYLASDYEDSVGKDYLNFESFFEFNLNSLSLHALFPVTFFGLIVSLLFITIPLNIYEREHGTVFTGVFLNLISVFSSILTGVAGKLLVLFDFIDLNNDYIPVRGMSGWIFVLLGFFSIRHYYQTQNKSMMTIIVPFCGLMTMNVLLYSHLDQGALLFIVYHTVSFLLGLLIARYETIFVLLAPPSKIIIKIEKVLTKLIGLIPSFVQYYKEKDMKRSLINDNTPSTHDIELPRFQD